jgi:uncharacterized protein (TIGR03067 family)
MKALCSVLIFAVVALILAGCPSSSSMLLGIDPELVGVWSGTGETSTTQGSARCGLAFTNEGGCVMSFPASSANLVGNYGTDSASSPRKLDFVVTDSGFGPPTGKICRGIYTIEQGILRYAYNPAGESRPASFGAALARLTLTRSKAQEVSTAVDPSFEAARAATGSWSEGILHKMLFRLGL